MKITPLLPLAAVVFLASCGGSTTDMNRPALTGVRTPVYEGMVSAMQGSQLTWLKPQTQVYVQGDSLDVNGTGFVKVMWGDSTGYVPAGWVILNGKKGVISVDGISPVFADAALTISGDARMGDWRLVTVGDVSDVSAQIMYADAEGEPALGYIDINEIYFDPLDLNFYDDFNNADGSVGSFEALRNSDKYASCRLAKRTFGDPEEGVGDVAQDTEQEAGGLPPSDGYMASTSNYHQPPVWYRNEGQAQLSETEFPGEFFLNYIWDDNTLSEINHFGDTLGNGYESCMPDFHKRVETYVMTFTPKEAMDFTLETTEYNESETPRPVVKQFTNVVPGEKYALTSTTIGYSNGCLPRTFTLRMKDGRYAEGTVGADCGD